MTSKKPVILLLDGNALVHRAFHALPPLTVSRTGEVVNAVRGFASTLLKLLREVKPEYWAVAFDRHAPTFRHEQYKDYKAQRPPTPPELISQIGRVHQLAEAMGMPVFELDGYEADDILGSLSRQAGQSRIDTLIATGDNDMLQVVTSSVNVMVPRKGFSDTVIYDEEKVKERYGLAPSQLIDLKALMGDSSDNIKGVRGIGEKTAAKLLDQFGTLEEIYARIDEVSPERVKNLLTEGKEQAFINKKLVTIMLDTPVELAPEKCRVQLFDRQKVIDLFKELEFVGLLAQLPEDHSGTAEPAAAAGAEIREASYTIVSSAGSLDKLIGELESAGEFAFDLETTGIDAMEAQIVGFSFSYKAGEACYIPVGHLGLSAVTQLPLPDVVDHIKPLMEDESIAKTAQNGKYDMTVLARSGIQTANLAFDTMIAAHLAGEKSLGLKALAFNKLGVEMTPISDLIGSGSKQISMAQVAIEDAARYAAADADMTLRLKELFQPMLKQEGLWNLFNDVEMPLVPLLMDMEMTGVAIDTGLLEKMSGEMSREIAGLEKDIYASVGHEFNINSTRQLSDILFKELGLPASRKTKSGYSTGASTLDELKGVHPVIELLLRYRQITKLKTTYVDAFLSLVKPATGRIHTSFNQTGTTTGRLSSSEPNLQNLPVRSEMGGRIRQAVIARPGWTLLSADYSQIDLRALAHISGDKELIDTFLRDEDVHTSTAARVFNIPREEVTPSMRRAAKTINFGVIYGMSGYGLEQATDFSRQQAEEFIKAYFEKYPGVSKYIERTKEQARKLGYVQTVLGRRRYVAGLNSSNRQVREAAERMAVNMPVQGTSADIIKVAMINLHKAMKQRKLASKMLLQVHDELVFELHPDEIETVQALVAELMPSALALAVPLKIDIKKGPNWGEMS